MFNAGWQTGDEGHVDTHNQIAHRLNRVIDAGDYGLSATNDAAQNDFAFARALAAIPANGGDLLLPPGSFRYASTLVLPRSTRLMGQSGFRYSRATELIYMGAGAAIQLGGNSVTISNLRLLTSSGSVGVDASDTLAHTFDTVEVNGFSAFGFAANNSYWSRWTRCVIQLGAPGGDTSAGIAAAGNFNQVVIDGCSFVYSPGQTWTAIKINGGGLAYSSGGSTIQNCDFSGGGLGGIMIRAHAGTNGLLLIGNRMESHGAGFFWADNHTRACTLVGNSLGGTLDTSPLVEINGQGHCLMGNKFDDSALGLLLGVSARRVYELANIYNDNCSNPIENLGHENLLSGLANAFLSITSTAKGVVLPRMTTSQRDALMPIAGMVIFNITTETLEYHNGSGWRSS